MKANLAALTLRFALALSVLPLPGNVSADEIIDPEKLAAIKQLMQVTGAEANSEQLIRVFTRQMVSILKINNPQISAKAQQVVGDEVRKMITEEMATGSLQQEIYPIYARYFTLEELNGLIKFNRSAVGIKANKVMPSLMQESMDAAQSWSQKIVPKLSDRVLNRFREENLLPPTESSH